MGGRDGPALVRSLAIGGGAIAVPLQVGGNLKDMIEAPDMEGLRHIDSKDILGPVYDAIPGGATPPDVRDDYLESYAGDRFAESTRSFALIKPICRSWRRGCPGSRRPSRSCVDETIHLCRWATRSSCTKGFPTTGWTFFQPGTLRGRKCRISTGTCWSVGSAPDTGSTLTLR